MDYSNDPRDPARLSLPRRRPPRWIRPGLPLLLATILAAATSVSVAGDWKGEEVTRDGARVIVNPPEPPEAPRTVQLEELWRLGGDSDADEEFFGVIGRVMTDDEGNVYLLDRQLSEVKVFTAEGRYLRTIGREGEGPGEFRQPSDMFFVPGGNVGVMQMMPGRIVVLTPEGDPVGEFPLPGGHDAGFRALHRARRSGDQLIVAGGLNNFSEGTIERIKFLSSIDQEGNELTRYYEEESKVSFADLVFREVNLDDFARRWTVGPDGRVYAVSRFEDYRIHVWNRDGSLDRIIEREHKPFKRTDKEMKEATKRFGININGREAEIEACDYAKAVESMHMRSDGYLWILSHEGIVDLPEDCLGRYDVFDPEGRFVRQVTLMGEGDPNEDGIFFQGDRVFVVRGLYEAARSLGSHGGDEEEEDEEEPVPIAVISYRLDEAVLAGGK